MNKFKCIYPNPFREKETQKDFDLDEILDEVCETMEPFFEENFYLISQDIDEFGYIRFDKRFIKILQDSVLKTSDYFKEKFKKKIPFLYNFVENKFLYLNTFQNYNENLRYLDLPVQSYVDKYGFETQILSNEIFEETLDKLEDGYDYIYSYAAETLPETTESWNDYVFYTTNYLNVFPNISHDEILESVYRSLDIFLFAVKKNYSTLSNTVLSADSVQDMIKVFSPIILTPRGRAYRFLWFKTFILDILFVLFVNYLTEKYGSRFTKNIRKINWLRLVTDTPIEIIKFHKATYIDPFIALKDVTTITSDKFDDKTRIIRVSFYQKIINLRTKLSILKTKTKYKLLKTIIGN